MTLNLDDYKYRGSSGFSLINYARLLFDVLKLDEKYSDLIVDAKIPGMKDMQKASAATALGAGLAVALGVELQKGTGGVILLKDCPIEVITIGERADWARTRCFFPVPEAKYGDSAISAREKGVFRKQVIGLNVKGHEVPGFEEIKQDQELLDRILSLFKTRLVCKFEYYSRGEICINFEKKKEIQYGIVESAILRASGMIEALEKKFGGSYLQVTRGLFDVLNDLAFRITAACNA